MNERCKKMTIAMYWCLFLSLFTIQICNGYSSNIIKDYHNKDYLTASVSNANKFEDNEIRVFGYASTRKRPEY
ncbi:CLUMA_CG013224, isoform A [Clunio marinus]|uniref:CLUMA_CG013224, isoform A n=1 Tax=Clunio marinus TaxID=568069 RepID=A0A1J1IN66_9DIPT|nr:CLUMA_CG013224, isoform A [Clunio marinus]